MQRKRMLYLLFVLALVLSMLPATALAQDPDSDETLLEQAKALAAEQNPTAPEAPSPLYFGESSTHPLFVGVDDTTVPAYQVDVVTNGFMQAFVGFQVWGSAYDPVTDKVYFNNGSTLYEWPVGGSVNTLGTIVNSAGATQSMTGLAFYDGQLYGVKNIANEAIWAIDTGTLVATVFIDYVDADLDCGGFSADPNTGTFYCTNDDATPHGAGLVIINPDASVTFVAAYPNGQTDIDGLAVSDDGFAYLVTDEPGFIYVYDLVGGAYVTPLDNPWTTSEVFSAGAWIWQPDTGGQCPAGPEVGELTPNTPVFNRPVGFGASCSLSGAGTAVHYDVYSYNLGGPAPHDLFASLVGGTTMDTVLVFYQAPDGSQNPFDPSQGCLNSVAYNDDFGGTLQSQINATNLGAGWIDVVVTTFGNGETGAYTMDVASQSCQAGGGEPNIDVDPLSLSSTQPTNTTTQQTLDVGNTGDADLTWTIAEEPASVVVPMDSLEAELLKVNGSSLPAAAASDTVSRGAPSGGPAPVEYTSLADFSEGFDDITNLPGWFTQNNSAPIGTTNWFQGNPTVFPAHAGATNAYIGANFNNTAGVGTISNWLLTPQLNLSDGDTFSFWTRVPTGGGVFPDRLELRLSLAGSSTNVGTLATDVGDFTTLLLSVNPNLTTTGYPEVWTQYTATLSGIPSGASGRFAFRYFVTNGGPSGSNSNYIGIDTVEYVSFEPQVCDAPSDVPWLSVNPTNGTTAPAATTSVDVTFDATGLAAGVYNANLCVTSNDPDPGPGNETELVIVPVELTVLAEPEIVLTKTVGTDPMVCATTNSIQVPVGSDVTYCYEVENTGDVTLNYHDLVDSELGALLSGLNYALVPGASAFVTETTNIAVTTVNTATWTAYQSPTGGLSATATATATVTVASIEIKKTVGTTPGVCAVTTSIDVPAGTQVFYCYTVTNTGDVTLNLHDLVDDQLGPIFTGLNYPLTPGSSVSTVDAGLSISTIINNSTTNVATWTAYNQGGPLVTSTATATVNVPYLDVAIELIKTVGTEPGVCAATTTINVSPGTEVYYCYTIINVGDVMLDLHDLVDDQLGTLFTDYPLALLPGDSVSTVDEGLVFSAVIDELTTNVATWTAYDPQGRTATTTATATVSVAPPTAVTLAGLSALPAPAAGLPVAALPALVGLALGAAYVLRRRAE